MGTDNIKKVAIFGGNGTLGSLVGGIIASFGNAYVYLICRDKSKIDKDNFLEKICDSIKTETIKNRIEIINYEEAKEKLCECDWIFESIFEDYNMKNEIYKFIDKYAKDETVISTGTSGLSIEKLSKNLSNVKKQNFFGTHFFNPPYKMTLCELIPSSYTDIRKMDKFKMYLQEILLRDIIFSKDKPAFIANRIGFKTLNDILIAVEKYQDKYEIDYIDSLFTGYTGRAMKPLDTIDFVGLDIHKAIINNIYENGNDEFNESFRETVLLSKLIENNYIGRKTKAGLYKKQLDDVKYVLNIKKLEYRPVVNINIDVISTINNLIKNGKYEAAYKVLINDDSEELELVKSILVNYIVYSIIVGKEVSNDICSCDVAMASGFDWCPPLALKDLFDKVCDFNEICKKYVDSSIILKYDLYKTLNKIPKSKYDYRKYIKAT